MAFNTFKQTHKDDQSAMTKKLEKLEKDMQASQDSAAECVVKKQKRDRGYEFKKKGEQAPVSF